MNKFEISRDMATGRNKTTKCKWASCPLQVGNSATKSVLEGFLKFFFLIFCKIFLAG